LSIKSDYLEKEKQKVTKY